MDNQYPYMLYHYTSLENFIKFFPDDKERSTKIKKLYFNAFVNPRYVNKVNHKTEFHKFISNNPYYLNFWISHVSYMNDPLENKYYFDFFLENISDYEKKNNYKVSKIESLKSFKENDVPYIFSMSASRDNLIMWRGYGKNGQGVALGFNFKKLEEKTGNINFFKCCYDENEFKNLFPEEKIKEIYEKIKVENNISIPGEIWDVIIKICCAVKHPAYREEEEFRLFIRSQSPDGIYYRNGLLVPYKVLELEISCLEEIIIGPTCKDVELNKLSIKNLIKEKLGYFPENLKITESSVPYKE